MLGHLRQKLCYREKVLLAGSKWFDEAAGSHPLILGSSGEDEADAGEFRGRQEKSWMFGEIVHQLPVLLGFFTFVSQ